MSESNIDYFLSQCDRCLYNTRNPYLPCTVHPIRITDDRCPDFKLDATLPADEWWEPEGASYSGNELVINTIQRWTREQQIALLNWHPMFTGRCPNCERTMLQTQPARVHWDCEHCEWKDDSV
ncbi:MAG: hypothetical protein J0L70_11080 [Leptolyngbya sp. UWPOB_LEPTO1]|uniref:hypothetical protein n=1 Tax=Leptolyngbya sp. UWPOB_LEPTO1 TaxID=2815653 RepID=UPI001AC47B2B|nr:hypothetical protein [Leptolyngbya sp. UWPOB_LEPTO1]MBN8561059.1 hypothetical protein [Leptolyngbya sp. UWPOB_LEPTO1]